MLRGLLIRSVPSWYLRYRSAEKFREFGTGGSVSSASEHRKVPTPTSCHVSRSTYDKPLTAVVNSHRIPENFANSKSRSVGSERRPHRIVRMKFEPQTRVSKFVFPSQYTKPRNPAKPISVIRLANRSERTHGEMTADAHFQSFPNLRYSSGTAANSSLNQSKRPVQG